MGLHTSVKLMSRNSSAYLCDTLAGTVGRLLDVVGVTADEKVLGDDDAVEETSVDDVAAKVKFVDVVSVILDVE